MRMMLAAAVLAVCGAGCDPKTDKVSTGKEFLERFQKAEQAKDAQALWSLMAKASRDERVAAAKKEFEQVKGNVEAAEKLKKEYGVTDEDPEKLAQAKLKKELEKPTDLRDAKFVEERADGQKVILVVEVGGKKREIPLVREDETLRICWDAKTGI